MSTLIVSYVSNPPMYFDDDLKFITLRFYSFSGFDLSTGERDLEWDEIDSQEAEELEDEIHEFLESQQECISFKVDILE